MRPTTLQELCAIIRESGRVLPVGGGTKPALSRGGEGVVPVSMLGLSGIVEYEPGEFTFTARAGTPLLEIITALAVKGQYLPWEPPLVEAGATLGGTIAAGLSGAGRFRFGGLRDFILAVQFVDGEGRVLRAGAKVVKNAAGFDVPKFLCGSAGRWGVITEATFKVFPAPASRLTVRIPCESVNQAVERLAVAGSARWELEALDFLPAELAIYARLSGPADANSALAAEIIAKWPEAAVLDADRAEQWWADSGEFRWAGDFLAKVPLTLGKVAGLIESLDGIPGSLCRISAGGMWRGYRCRVRARRFPRCWRHGDSAHGCCVEPDQCGWAYGRLRQWRSGCERCSIPRAGLPRWSSASYALARRAPCISVRARYSPLP